MVVAEQGAVTRIAAGDWGRRRSEGLIAAQHPHEAGNLTAGGCERLLRSPCDQIPVVGGAAPTVLSALAPDGYLPAILLSRG